MKRSAAINDNESQLPNKFVNNYQYPNNFMKSRPNGVTKKILPERMVPHRED